MFNPQNKKRKLMKLFLKEKFYKLEIKLKIKLFLDNHLIEEIGNHNPIL